jgi:hypothetical protein
MFTKNLSAFRYLFLMALTFLLIFSLSSVAFSQRTGGDGEKKITLKKNKKVNGYKIQTRGEGEFYVNILGAVNPLTGKKLDGKYKFVYRCAQVVGLITVAVILAKGYVEQKIRCSPAYDPYLLY